MMIRTTVRTREGRSFHESGTDPLDLSTRDRGPRVHQGRRARIGPRIRPIRARTASDATLAALADNSQRALRVGFPGIGGIQFVATRDRVAETSADCSPVTLGRGASREAVPDSMYHLLLLLLLLRLPAFLPTRVPSLSLFVRAFRGSSGLPSASNSFELVRSAVCSYRPPFATLIPDSRGANNYIASAGGYPLAHDRFREGVLSRRSEGYAKQCAEARSHSPAAFASAVANASLHLFRASRNQRINRHNAIIIKKK